MTAGPRRVFEHQRLWRMTRPGYQAGTEILAEAAISRLGEITAVIGIAHGGVAPAYAIASRSAAPVVVVRARHNPTDATYTQATGRIEFDSAALAPLATRAGRFLVVDDICGTGGTLATVTSALSRVASPEATICTAALCRNAGSPPGVPDMYVWDVADWVVFPWEPASGARRVTSLPVPTEVRTS